MAAAENSRWRASGDKQRAVEGDCGGFRSVGGGVGAGLTLVITGPQAVLDEEGSLPVVAQMHFIFSLG
jgi:hypothetical protein